MDEKDDPVGAPFEFDAGPDVDVDNLIDLGPYEVAPIPGASDGWRMTHADIHLKDGDELVYHKGRVYLRPGPSSLVEKAENVRFDMAPSFVLKDTEVTARFVYEEEE